LPAERRESQSKRGKAAKNYEVKNTAKKLANSWAKDGKKVSRTSEAKMYRHARM